MRVGSTWAWKLGTRRDTSTADKVRRKARKKILWACQPIDLTIIRNLQWLFIVYPKFQSRENPSNKVQIFLQPTRQISLPIESGENLINSTPRRSRIVMRQRHTHRLSGMILVIQNYSRDNSAEKEENNTRKAKTARSLNTGIIYGSLALQQSTLTGSGTPTPHSRSSPNIKNTSLPRPSQQPTRTGLRPRCGSLETRLTRLESIYWRYNSLNKRFTAGLL